jgi:hypothetical protein
MWTKRSILILMLATVSAACASPRPGGVARPHPSAPPVHRQPGDLLILGSGRGLTAIDSSTGSILSATPGTPAVRDWSKVFTARHEGGMTLLQTMAVDTGQASFIAKLQGDLAIRVVSPDGVEVALMSPLPKGLTPWTPQPRSRTTIVVADPTGQTAARRFRLEGNFEPEAFSTDGEGLFMISYLPPTSPAAYQVVRLNLADGKVTPVFGRQKSPVETMAGTRLMQVASPDGTRLYTLYTNQPPSYAKGYDASQAGARRPVAFVHTLATDDGWAICVGLPKTLWAAIR